MVYPSLASAITPADSSKPGTSPSKVETATPLNSRGRVISPVLLLMPAMPVTAGSAFSSSAVRETTESVPLISNTVSASAAGAAAGATGVMAAQPATERSSTSTRAVRANRLMVTSNTEYHAMAPLRWREGEYKVALRGGSKEGGGHHVPSFRRATTSS